jgi:hypothetical protein
MKVLIAAWIAVLIVMAVEDWSDGIIAWWIITGVYAVVGAAILVYPNHK